MAREHTIKRIRQRRRRARTRAKARGTAERPRLSVFRSARHITAQLIDDEAGRTLAAASDVGLDVKGSPVERARAVGAKLAALAQAKQISRAVFDRGSFRYSGRVRALADGAREAGLKF